MQLLRIYFIKQDVKNNALLYICSPPGPTPPRPAPHLKMRLQVRAIPCPRQLIPTLSQRKQYCLTKQCIYASECTLFYLDAH